jgi:SCY1-like protein 2
MFAAATSFFSRSNISQNYAIGVTSNASRTATPTPASGATTSSATLPAPAHVPSFQVGLWRVQSATHKVTGKRVSVWTFDKRNAEIDRLTPMAKEKSMDVLKAEVGWSPKRRPHLMLMTGDNVGYVVEQTTAPLYSWYAHGFSHVSVRGIYLVAGKRWSSH